MSAGSCLHASAGRGAPRCRAWVALPNAAGERTTLHAHRLAARAMTAMMTQLKVLFADMSVKFGDLVAVVSVVHASDFRQPEHGSVSAEIGDRGNLIGRHMQCSRDKRSSHLR